MPGGWHIAVVDAFGVHWLIAQVFLRYHAYRSILHERIVAT